MSNPPLPDHYTPPDLDPSREHQAVRGIGVSAGYSIGVAHLVDRSMPDFPEYCVTPAHIEEERQRFLDALSVSRQQLRDVRDRVIQQDLHNPELLYILDAHRLILEDGMLREGTLAYIDQKCNAEWAIKRYLDDVTTLFLQMDDICLREKQRDIEQECKRVMHNLLGARPEQFYAFMHPVILVAEDFSPSDTLLMNREGVLGFVTQMGGPTSHTAILARSLGLPAIVGAPFTTHHIHAGDPLIIDGVDGILHIHPDDATLTDYEKRRRRFNALQKELQETPTGPARTKDGHRILLKANIELEEEADSAFRQGTDGIGLYRTENLYMNRTAMPDEEELTGIFSRIVQTMHGLPVTIRTLDIGGEKQSEVFWNSLDHDTPNPALGVRALRLCLQREPAVFQTQIRAILRAGVHGPVRILFPLVSDVGEVIEARSHLDKARTSLDEEGIPYLTDIEVGCMIEVPSAALTADIIAPHVDFFSIGTNDLIQFAFGIDRMNSAVSYLYQPAHPAMIRLLKSVCDAGHDHGVQVMLCGEMAGDPRLATLLVGLGLDGLSVSHTTLPVIRRMIHSLSYQDAKQMAEELLISGTTDAILDQLNTLVQNTLGSSMSDISQHSRKGPQ
ncbi:MAG: phosphoenolpyruvate--protein phosphotransferase [Magnetococcales bacterium]|nr:phosphoenolpyruvate--protein phosphotransferase [Magnetococcales bacterium]